MQSFVYKWTNKITNEYYIGVHKGTPEDGYIGSGKLFLNKYNKCSELFERCIIKTFDNYQDALEYEKKLVNEETLADINCLNLKKGGEGGGSSWNSIRKKNHSNRMIEKWKDPAFREKTISSINRNWTETYKKQRKESGTIGFPNDKIDFVKRADKRKENAGPNGYGKHRLGYVFSDLSKSIMSDKAKNREKINCPHCGKTGPKPQMKQWHFDNCKGKQ